MRYVRSFWDMKKWLILEYLLRGAEKKGEIFYIGVKRTPCIV